MATPTPTVNLRNIVNDPKSYLKRAYLDEQQASPNLNQLVPFVPIEFKHNTPWKVVESVQFLEDERKRLHKTISEIDTSGTESNNFGPFIIAVPKEAYKDYEQSSKTKEDQWKLLNQWARFIWDPKFINNHILLYIREKTEPGYVEGYSLAFGTGEYIIGPAGPMETDRLERFLRLLSKYKQVVAELNEWRTKI